MHDVWKFVALLPAACTVVQPPPETPAASAESESAPTAIAPVESTESSESESADVASVHVFAGKASQYPCEVVGVLDFHSNADSEDKGFVELRRRAAALGADSVIGAEFEHGEGREHSHLSGMAARCSNRP